MYILNDLKICYENLVNMNMMLMVWILIDDNRYLY